MAPSPAAAAFQRQRRQRAQQLCRQRGLPGRATRSHGAAEAQRVGARGRAAHGAEDTQHLLPLGAATGCTQHRVVGENVGRNFRPNHLIQQFHSPLPLGQAEQCRGVTDDVGFQGSQHRFQ